jgi:ADP-heptose:LPS heptosyltransferase
MHLASLFGVPVVSIWGATHPFAGFYGFGQQPENIIQADLYCRPCSVFGNKKCYRGDWACMQMIKPAQITGKVEEVLHRSLQ